MRAIVSAGLVGISCLLMACDGGPGAGGTRDYRGGLGVGAALESNGGELSPELRREIGLDPAPAKLAELGPELRREIGLDPEPSGEAAGGVEVARAPDAPR